MILESESAPAWRICTEAAAFFGAAFLLFCLHVFHSGKPNITLLFDSFGYLSTANSLIAVITPATIKALWAFLSSGLSGVGRHELMQLLEPVREVTKTGPVLPLMVGCFYSVFHKPAMPVNWQWGAYLMILCQSMTVLFIYLLGRLSFGSTVARTAACLALVYSPLTINANRLLSEIPAALIVAVSLTCMCWSQRLLEEARGRIVAGITYGVSLGTLAMARPNLTALPLLLLLVMLIQQRSSLKGMRLVSLLLAVVVSAGLTLLPWAGFKYILTGTPSISIDRNTAMNIWAGSDIIHDSWDVQPFASHPEEFETPVKQVISQVGVELLTRPWSYLYMMARKPARLLDSPWNDFQSDFFGVPWVCQRLFHQIILFLALLGACQGFELACQRSDRRLLGASALLSAAVLYHLISCLFIAMGRYFYTGVAPLMVLAGFGLQSLVSMKGHQRLLVTTALVSAPLYLCVVNYSPDAPAGWMPLAAAVLGTPVLSALLASGAAILVGLAFLALWRTVTLPWLRIVLMLAVLKAVVLTFAAVYFQIHCLEYPISLPFVTNIDVTSAAHWDQEQSGSDQEQSSSERSQSASDNKPPATYHYFLLADVYSFSRGSEEPLPLSAELNGVKIEDRFLPLWALDRLNHEGLLYETQFAYALDRPVLDFRQWVCVPVPDGLVKQKNRVALNWNAKGRACLFADFADSGHSLSLDEYSWSKAYMVGSPGDARLDVWNKPAASGVLPRLYLLRLPAQPVSTVSRPGLINLAPLVEVSPKGVHLGELKISQEQIQSQLPPPQKSKMVKATLSCSYRGLDAGHKLLSSVVLLNTVQGAKGSEEFFASMAPLKLESLQNSSNSAPQESTKNSENWSSLQYDETIPLLDARDRKFALTAFRVLVAGRCWWNVLAYGQFNPSGAFQYRDLQLRLEECPSMNLGSGDWEILRSEPLSPGVPRAQGHG